MKRFTFALTLAATLAMPGCLQKDTTSTICLRPDGSFDWIVLEQNVRSDESDQAARLKEEAGYADTVARGELGTVSGFLALGGEDVRVRWLRSSRPYAVMIDARFGSLSRMFDRLLLPCGIPYQSEITTSAGVTTWTLRADVGVDGERLEAAAQEGADACGQDVGGLSDALDELRIVLESGDFTAATGFTLQGATEAVIDEKALEEAVKTTGVVDLSLSWR
jgi:hypothetical protein